MGLNETASADRLHIGFFGKRNAGKSSLVNAVTGQETSVVSEVKGTTTDPVRKAMELLPLGPVVIIDTPGLDDEGDLGELRVKRALQVLNTVDIAVVVVSAALGLDREEAELCELLKKKNIPYIIAYTKSDLIEKIPEAKENEIYVSALDNINIDALKDKIVALNKSAEEQRVIVSDLIKEGDVVVLVVPIDKAAPKGRLILPQQQTIRDILDAGAHAFVCRDSELEGVLSKLSEKPRMVITDSQVFGKVSKIVPRDIELTSFSILFARYKGNLRDAVRGAAMLDRLSHSGGETGP
ncbi:MAG: [Clostridia bacterium]|nr:[FeFe] hydrogenase H-cluster maturation GTPase HydF [Clostridia bacterium]